MTLFSLAGSLDLASHTQWPENGSEKMMNATSGQRCLEQFGRFPRVGSWAKTFSALLIGTGEWCSMRCRLTWKLKGTKYNRLYFQLAPSTLRTDEIGFGLWLLKTPTRMDGEVSSGKKNPTSGNSGTLAQEIMSEYPPTMAKLGLLPTPTAQDFKRRGPNSKQQGLSNTENWTKLLPTPRANQVNGCDLNSKSLANRNKGNLEESIAKMLVMGMLPTPATRDYKGARTSESLQKAGRNHTNSLPDSFSQPGKTSQLNPQFVAEMMGFPPNWTELPFLNGETNQSKQQETP